MFDGSWTEQLIFLSDAVMNLSHVINEFSFGPFFPRISQPLDNSVEMASSRESGSSNRPQGRAALLLTLLGNIHSCIQTSTSSSILYRLSRRPMLTQAGGG